MNVLKVRFIALSLTILCFACTPLFSRASVDNPEAKMARPLISKILKNVHLKDTAKFKADTTRKKIQGLIVELTNVVNKKDTVFTRLKSFSLEKSEKNHVDSLLKGFTTGVASLKTKIIAFEASAKKSSGPGEVKHNQSDSSAVIDSLRQAIKAKNDTLVNLRSNGSKPDLAGSPLFKFIAAALLLALLVVGFLYYRKLTENKDISSVSSNLLSEIRELEERNKVLKTEYDSLKESHDTLMQRHRDALEQLTKFSAVPVPSKSEKYFFGEAMVTAGPRKDFTTNADEGDYGLGEDVAGFSIRNDKAFFWVLDGTSDSDTLTKPILTSDSKEEEYFSSRLLAQSIGWNLQQLINEKGGSRLTASELLQQAIANTGREWKAKIDGLNSLNREALAEALKNKNNVLQCSTTAVFGSLSLNGDLDICRIGDTKIVAYPGNNDFPKSTGRQFVTLILENEEVKLSFIEFGETRNQIIQLPEIRTLLVMTDGISNQMEGWLRGRNDLDFDRKDRELFAKFKQKTYDDKAVCIIQIKE